MPHTTYAWQKGRRHEAAGDVLVVAPLRAGDEHAVLVGRAVLLGLGDDDSRSEF